MKDHSAAEKKRLREEYRGRLLRLGFMDLVEKSSLLTGGFHQFRVGNLGLFRSRSIVSFYPFETEPQINIEEEGAQEPYGVAYVRIEDWANRLMSARLARRDLPGMWEERDIPGGGKIFQPDSTRPLCSGDEIAVVLVPGLAFTREGARLGRGAGFYDRFLAAHPRALRIGIGFSEQLTDRLPVEPLDQAMDMLLTDEGVLPMKGYGEWQKHGKILSRDPP